MADTRTDVTITTGTWRDLYTASGITVGTAVSVVNKGSSSFHVCVAATAPPVPSSGSPKGIPVYPSGLVSSSVDVAVGASGLWAYCATPGNAYALVQE